MEDEHEVERDQEGVPVRRRKADPLVSIVTPSFNQVQYLETCLRSVLSQDYQPIEYIVVDGGSTDGSIEILERYRDHFRHWSSEPDHGQADAINKGLRMARGEYVAWLNSDDAYLPGAVGEAVRALENDPSLGMVYGDGLMVDASLRLLDRHTYPQVSVLDLLCFEVILQPAVFLRRSAIEQVGYLDPSYQLILDHELWVRIASRFPVRHISSNWAIERTHERAKTIAQAGDFVEEAERLVRWAASDPTLGDLVQRQRRRVFGGLDVFAARRLIDAGEYRPAVRRLWRAMRRHPLTVMRYWYKLVQAVGSALGMAELFFGYRRARRQVVHAGRIVALEGGGQGGREPGAPDG